MAKGFKGITVEIDGSTDKLDHALSKVNSTSKSLQTELKGVNSLLNLDPKNTDLAAQKQMLLSQAVQQTEEKLKLLETAQKQAAAAGATINDEAYRNLQREIVLTKSKLQDLKGQKKTFDELQKGAESFGTKVANIVNKIPVVNKLAAAFGKAKTKIAETVKESAAVQKIGSAVEGAKKKVEDFKNAHPAVQKIADAFGKVKTAADELVRKIPSVTQTLQAAGNAAATAAKGGWSALKMTVGGTIKAFAAFSTAAATAMTTIIKGSVENYGDYEQLVGGVETLFGAGGQSLSEYAKSVGKTTKEAKGEYNNLIKAQEAVLKKADGAYKTAGMSANDYMETVTSMSAALIQSLDGDTVAAAKKADMAITDMSDNANKMGSDIGSIKNAYSGFAKANYTMLDNLKLGYGGTKEEMQRLLDDATKISGVEYDLSQYGDIVDAIHVVQTEMGITGTTAKEAATTIQGSIASAKAAWTNLQTGFADENADLDALIDQMIEAVGTVVDNIAPRIMQTINSVVSSVPKIISGLSGIVTGIAGQIGELAQALLPQLTQAFFGLISSIIEVIPQLLPQLLTAAAGLFTGILTGLNTVIPQLAEQIPTIIDQIVTALTENLSQIIQAGTLILVNLINGITNAIPSLIEAIITLFPIITTALLENLPLIIEAGLNLLTALATGIVQALPLLIAMLPEIIATIVSALASMLPQIVETGLNLLIALITGIVQALPQLIAMLPQIITTIVSTLASMLPQILEAGTTLLEALTSGIVQAIPQLIAALPQIISTIVNTLATHLPQIISAGIQLLGALISGLIQAIPMLIAAIPQITKAIFDTIKAVNWGELGTNIISGIKEGVVSAAENLVSAVKDTAKAALKATKEVLGIHSPSRVFRDQVGKQMAAGQLIGYEEGMEDNMDAFAQASRKCVPTTIDSYINIKPKQQLESSAGGKGDFIQNLTINSPRELSPSETARQTRNATRQMVLKLKHA